MEDVADLRRINVDVTAELKKRIMLFCAKEDMKIRELVIMAIEGTLDELEGGSNT